MSGLDGLVPKGNVGGTTGIINAIPSHLLGGIFGFAAF
jgi:hypothetical protein|tara:strand:+ start:4967 stop:5080 length:114 start_codon:yes stop_codon:yes gene_type:complete